MTATPPEQAPPAQPQPPAPTLPTAATPPETGKQPPWGSDENFDPAKAWDLIQNLRKEGADPTLKAELDAMKKAQDDQQAALAAALGVKPEETSDSDKLAQQVADLQAQFARSQLQATVLTVAQNNGIPPEFQGWLTATDPDALEAQAKALVPMVQATLAARGQAPLVGQPGAPAAPAFAPNPGQGQAAQPPAGDMAGFESYYDPTTGRPRF